MLSKQPRDNPLLTTINEVIKSICASTMHLKLNPCIDNKLPEALEPMNCGACHVTVQKTILLSM